MTYNVFGGTLNLAQSNLWVKPYTSFAKTVHIFQVMNPSFTFSNDTALQWCVLHSFVKWMCGIKLQDRVPSKGLRERLGLVWHNLGSRYYSKTGCDGMGMYCKMKTMIGWRNVWNMKWRVPNQEVNQRKLGERLWKKTVRHINWTGRMPWIIIDGGSR